MDTAMSCGGEASRADSASSETMAARRSAMLGLSLMAAPYDRQTALESLIATARQLRAAGPPCRLAPLVMMHDRDRTPDIETLAQALPRGSALIYREALGQHDVNRAKRGH